jgi:hypothetical protein
MKHTQLKYNYIKSVDSWENPIVKEGFYEDSQIAEFTGCWDENDNYYEVLFYDAKTYCIDSNGNECNLPDTDNWQEQDTIFLYHDEDTNTYYEQNTNGNFWYEIDKPLLVPAF